VKEGESQVTTFTANVHQNAYLPSGDGIVHAIDAVILPKNWQLLEDIRIHKFENKLHTVP